MLHKCTDTVCRSFGQRTTNSCGCHQSDEQVLTAENQILREALRHCHSALETLVAPNAIKQTSVINAFAQCTEAEVIARHALSWEQN